MLQKLINLLVAILDNISVSNRNVNALTDTVEKLNDSIGEPTALFKMRSRVNNDDVQGLLGQPQNLVLTEALVEFHYSNMVYAALDKTTQERAKQLLDKDFLLKIEGITSCLYEMEKRLDGIDKCIRNNERYLVDAVELNHIKCNKLANKFSSKMIGDMETRINVATKSVEGYKTLLSGVEKSIATVEQLSSEIRNKNNLDNSTPHRQKRNKHGV